MKYASIELNSEGLLGKMMRSLLTGTPLRLRINQNDKEGNEARPDYKSFDGISIWIKED